MMDKETARIAAELRSEMKPECEMDDLKHELMKDPGFRFHYYLRWPYYKIWLPITIKLRQWIKGVRAVKNGR